MATDRQRAGIGGLHLEGVGQQGPPGSKPDLRRPRSAAIVNLCLAIGRQPTNNPSRSGTTTTGTCGQGANRATSAPNARRMLIGDRSTCHLVVVMSRLTPMSSLQSTFARAAKGLSQAAALSALAATGLIFANPGAVQAANPACASSAKLSVYLTPCDTADQFTFTLVPTPTFLPNDTLSVTSTATSFTLGLLSNATWGPGTYAFKYSITAPPGKLLSNYSSSLTSSVSSTPGGDVGAWDVNGANGIAGSTFSTPTGSNGNKVYSPKISSDTFTSTLTVTKGVIQSVTSTVNVVDAPRSKVPGPLPLLGAGAAFGFSRRLRQRVKLAV